MSTAIQTSFLENCWFFSSNGMKESFLYCVGLRYETVHFFGRVPNFRSRNWTKGSKFLRKLARTFQATSRHNRTDHKMNLHHNVNLKSREIFLFFQVSFSISSLTDEVLKKQNSELLLTACSLVLVEMQAKVSMPLSS